MCDLEVNRSSPRLVFGVSHPDQMAEHPLRTLVVDADSFTPITLREALGNSGRDVVGTAGMGSGWLDPIAPDKWRLPVSDAESDALLLADIRGVVAVGHSWNPCHTDVHGRLLACRHRDAAAFVGATACGIAPAPRGCLAGSSADRPTAVHHETGSSACSTGKGD